MATLDADPRYAQLPKEDALKALRFYNCLQVFRNEVDTAIPNTYMAAFMLVALNPGKGSSDYAKDLGLAQPVTSRILLEIGKKSRTGGEGYGLIDSDQDPVDLRLRRNYLTPKGKQLLKKLLTAAGRY